VKKSILCDDCNKQVGEIEKDALVSATDQYVGIEIYCKKCKSNRINQWYDDVNQLLREPSK